mgnify:FL=1
MTPTPRTFSHIGISVPDLDAAVSFYSEVMGFYVIMQPSEVIEDDSAIGVMCTDVFGPGWDRLRIAHLSTADGIGFELFEFEGNGEPDDNFAYRRHGTFHFAVQDPNLEELLEKIVAPEVSSACLSANISPTKSRSAWFTSRTRSVSSSRFIAIATS